MPIGSTLNGLKTLPRENIPPKTRIVRKAASEEDKEKVRDMWKSGLSAYKISEQTGFAVPTIYNWCKNISKPNKQEHPQVDEEMKQQAKELYESGMTIPLIASTIGVSEKSIYNWRNKYNWEEKEMEEKKTVNEEQKQEKEHASPCKMLKVDDVEKCTHLIDSVLDLINLEISALDPWGAYSIGKSQCYLETITEILSKED